jgi:RNA polymerase sigma factor (sigma-70 family)
MFQALELDEPEDWSDARFLELARGEGREQAYRLLVAHLTRLRGYLEPQFSPELGGPLGVEEVVHEAAWRAVERVASYRPERGGVLHWAWSIGVHLAKDRVRAEQARHVRERTVARTEGVDAGDLLELVLAAIEGLPDRSRAILRFDLDHDGLGPAAEIAAQLGVSVKTIYNLRVEARAQLKDVLR